MMTTPTRQRIVQCAQAHVKARTPYQWGGGHHGDSWGLDCSGLVLDCMRKVGIDPGFWDSSRMRNELPETKSPQPGDLALYLPRHVVIVEKFDPKTGIATIIGANGGDSSSTSVEKARQQKAMVKREPTHLYRQTFVGFRSIAPWGVEDWSGSDRTMQVAFAMALVGAIGFWYLDRKYNIGDAVVDKIAEAF